jgi:hypothetical protein
VHEIDIDFAFVCVSLTAIESFHVKVPADAPVVVVFPTRRDLGGQLGRLGTVHRCFDH